MAGSLRPCSGPFFFGHPSYAESLTVDVIQASVKTFDGHAEQPACCRHGSLEDGDTERQEHIGDASCLIEKRRSGVCIRGDLREIRSLDALVLRFCWQRHMRSCRRSWIGRGSGAAGLTARLPDSAAPAWAFRNGNSPDFALEGDQRRLCMMGRVLVIGRQAIRKAHTTFWQGFLVLRRRHLDVCVKSAPPNRRTSWAGGETRMRVPLAGFGGVHGRTHQPRMCSRSTIVRQIDRHGGKFRSVGTRSAG